jgi:hypothetical protein
MSRGQQQRRPGDFSKTRGGDASGINSNIPSEYGSGGGSNVDANGQKLFHKPRALSRQTDAHIKIEVHRDETIINHLQRE